MIYLCFHEDLINMHKYKPEVTLNYHIWKCYVIGSQSKFEYIKNVYTCPNKINTSSKIACIYDAEWNNDLRLDTVMVFRKLEGQSSSRFLPA